MNRRKKIATTVAGLATIGVVALIPNTVSAAEDSDSETFVSQLAEKLGINQDTVQNAVDEIREEKSAERQAEILTEIEEEVSSGELTERQGEILTAITEYQPSFDKPDRPIREEIEDLTQEERQAKREEFRAEREQELLDYLNEQGLNVTSDELESTKEAARDAGINAGFGGKTTGRFGRGVM